MRQVQMSKEIQRSERHKRPVTTMQRENVYVCAHRQKEDASVISVNRLSTRVRMLLPYCTRRGRTCREPVRSFPFTVFTSKVVESGGGAMHAM